jgi:hypothetical protein
VLLHYLSTITPTVARPAGSNKKAKIGNTDSPRLTTLVNSASMAPLIGLLPKMAEFCYTSNRLLVER